MADAVVVGGGSAGYVLAARLREDAACRVVLLEAGQDLAGLTDAPPDVLGRLGADAGARLGLPGRAQPTRTARNAAPGPG